MKPWSHLLFGFHLMVMSVAALAALLLKTP